MTRIFEELKIKKCKAANVIGVIIEPNYTHTCATTMHFATFKRNINIVDYFLIIL